MDSKEFTEWMLFDQIEPWGNPWHHTTLIASKIHNAHFNEKVTQLDLLPGIRPEEEKQDVEAVLKRAFGISD